jgi:hypothetical protein
LVFGAAAACGGSGGVGAIAHSTLSRAVPSVSPFELAGALPAPADFGPGWTFDTTSLGNTDYFQEFLLNSLLGDCKGASPKDQGIAVSFEQAVSGSLNAPQPPGYVWVRIAVDSPAASADKMALMRADFTHCPTSRIPPAGAGGTETYVLLPPMPEVRADDSFAVRITSHLPGAVTTDEVETWAYARVGGLVVAVVGLEGVNPVPLLPKALAKVRNALRL